jgi:hypothetical protein
VPRMTPESILLIAGTIVNDPETLSQSPRMPRTTRNPISQTGGVWGDDRTCVVHEGNNQRLRVYVGNDRQQIVRKEDDRSWMVRGERKGERWQGLCYSRSP